MTDEKMPAKNNQSMIIVIVLIAIVIIGGGIFAFTSSQPNKTNDTSLESQDGKTAKAMGYVDYTTEVEKMASNKDVVLFFKASWCPTCNATDKDINANLSSIPENLIIAKVDYDKEVGLKQKYGITMQHTFVKIDQNGNELAKKNGLNTLTEIASFASMNTATSKSIPTTPTTANETSNSSEAAAKPGSTQTAPAQTTNPAPTTTNEEPKTTNTITTPVQTSGSYTPYSADMISKASTGNVVLFFKASWCPTCIATEKDINSNLGKIPSNLTILAVDYDKETELKKKYGITTQHSFVKVDKDGNELKKSPYGQTKTLENIIDFAS